MGNMKDDDLQVQEFRVDSEDGRKDSDESADGPHIAPRVALNATLPESKSDEEPRAAPGTCGTNSSEGPDVVQSGQKEPCESGTVGNGEKTAHKVPSTSTGTYASPVSTLKQQNQTLDDDAVPDCYEDEKAESKKPSGNKGEVSSEGENLITVGLFDRVSYVLQVASNQLVQKWIS